MDEVMRRITIEIQQFNLDAAQSRLRHARSQIKWSTGQGIIFMALGVFSLVWAFHESPWYAFSAVVYAGAGAFFIWWARKRWLSHAWSALRDTARARIELRKAHEEE